jgi:hypothetical protein
MPDLVLKSCDNVMTCGPAVQGIKQYVDKHSTASRQLGHGSDEDAWVYYCERNNGPNAHFPYNVGSFAFTKTLRSTAPIHAC